MIPDSRSLWTLPHLADRQLAQAAQRVFVEVVSDTGTGPAETYAEFLGRSAALAGRLAGLGVVPGDRVAILLPNGIPALHAWMAIALAGAVEVPLRPMVGGEVLRHALSLGQCRTLIADTASAAILADVLPGLPFLQRIVWVCGGDGAMPAGPSWVHVESHSYEAAIARPAALPHAGVRPGDAASVMFTSGTSGPAKGVVLPHAQLCLLALECIQGMRAGPDDVFYCVHPLNHIAGKFMGVLAMFAVGGKVVLDARFDAARWLERIRRHGVTVSIAHGPMLEMIAATPPSPDDRKHAMWRLMCSPMPRHLTEAFEARFGVRRIEMWGMTETACVTWTNLDEPHPLGSAGKLLSDWYDFQIADPDTDEPCQVGSVGEIMVRPRYPYTMMQEYLSMPEETVKAWRNCWFHTGDAGYLDEAGNLYFVERLKDRIRSRSENISSYDIEVAARALPGVAEAVAVGVPSEFEGDDDIKLYVVPAAEGALSELEMLRQLACRLPHFMLPRYIEFIESIPRTPTQKVRKAELRKRPAGPATWDRKAAGVRLRELYSSPQAA